jgi:head-tail adaptor
VLPVSELQILQNTVTASLDVSCQIQRRVNAPDSYGSQGETWQTLATVDVNVSQPTAGQMQNYDYLIGSLEAWQVRLPVGTDVQRNDHLLIADQVLEVQAVLAPKSYAISMRVLASEIR